MLSCCVHNLAAVSCYRVYVLLAVGVAQLCVIGVVLCDVVTRGVLADGRAGSVCMHCCSSAVILRLSGLPATVA